MSPDNRPADTGTEGAGEVMRSVPLVRTAQALTITVVAASVFGWLMLGEDIRARFTPIQIGTLVFFLVFIAVGMLALGYSAAQVDPTGITVRNLVRTSHFSWTELEGVEFGDGDAWAYLRLAPTAEHPEGRTHVVLAVQRIDHAEAERKVGVLAAAIASHFPDRPHTL